MRAPCCDCFWYIREGAEASRHGACMVSAPAVSVSMHTGGCARWEARKPGECLHCRWYVPARSPVGMGSCCRFLEMHTVRDHDTCPRWYPAEVPNHGD